MQREPFATRLQKFNRCGGQDRRRGLFRPRMTCGAKRHHSMLESACACRGT